MVRLSIIIPAMGHQQHVEDTLVSVLANRPRDCEIIVVFPGPYDDPYDLRGEVRFIEVDHPASRLDLANVGIAASRGEVIHLLAPGIEVDEGWADRPMRCFAEDATVGSVCPMIVNAQDRGRIVSAGVRYGPGGRRHLVGRGKSHVSPITRPEDVDGPTANAAFYRKSVMDLTRGFALQVGDAMADVDLAMTLRRLGYRCVFQASPPLVGNDDTNRQPSSGLQHGRFAERLFWRHAAASGWVRSLLLHPVEVARDFVVRLPHMSAFAGLIGRVVALGEMACGIQSPITPARTEPPRPDDAATHDQWGADRIRLREAG